MGLTIASFYQVDWKCDATELIQYLRQTMTNVTYNIPLSNTTNESQKDAGNPGLVCSDMFPTTDVYFQGTYA